MSNCTIVYALEDPPASFTRSIFLAGPTPRTPAVPSWRPEAVALLERAGFNGVIFVPEDRSGTFHGDFEAQVAWEDRCLHLSDRILFWVPRDTVLMPAFTTNVEFGRWEDTGKIVFGAPPEGVKNRYLRHYADKLSVPRATTLEETVRLTVETLGAGARRTGGEREVPLHIWSTPSFQQWYRNLQLAGNRLEHARVAWTFRVGPERRFVFFWALHVDIYIANEQRHKTNEVVLARPDISTIVLYRRGNTLDDSTVVLVREFRSPVSNEQGYVYEAAGGSSFKPGGNPLELAADEVHEETDLVIDASRFRMHEARQMVATMSTHQAHLFSVELTEEELRQVRDQAGIAFGVLEDTERTYVEVMTLRDIRQTPAVDWSMLGMILQALA